MKVVVCLDGEPHTRGAIERAIEISLSESAELVGLHVVDEWLRQFSSEIYAQGRKEYLEWVDSCLHEKAADVSESFLSRCAARGVEAGFVLRDGEPLAEIAATVRELEADLVLTGGKSLRGWARLRSGELPTRLKRRLAHSIDVVIVTADTADIASPRLQVTSRRQAERETP